MLAKARLLRWLPLIGLPIAACTGGQPHGDAVAGAEVGARAVPRAVCSEGDRPETGLQGHVPADERLGGFDGFSCNLELVGHYPGQGAGWQHAWFDDCAYYGVADNDELDRKGVVALDVADSTAPQATAHLQEPAMIDPWESLEVNQPNALLGGVENGGANFAVYDLASDCTQPQLLGSAQIADPAGEMQGHAGSFAPDGMIYYGAPILAGAYPIDISDPSNPQLIGQHRLGVSAHDLSVSEDGNRLYVAQPSITGGPNNGLVIYDVSTVQQRLPAAEAIPLGSLFWSDGSVAQDTVPVTIDGTPYIIFTDEQGSLGVQGIGPGKQGACDAGLPPNAMARIIDISIENAPMEVSKLALEVHDPANCEEILAVDDGEIFLYDSHYCSVDNPDDARIVACTYMESGLRVFDIRDPAAPKEIAYYNPPGSDPDAFIPGSQHELNRDVSWTSSKPRIRLDRNEIWFTSQDKGFMVVRFRSPLEELLEAVP